MDSNMKFLADECCDLSMVNRFKGRGTRYWLYPANGAGNFR